MTERDGHATEEGSAAIAGEVLVMTGTGHATVDWALKLEIGLVGEGDGWI